MSQRISPFRAASASARALFVSYLIVHSAEWREPLSLINTPAGQHWNTSARCFSGGGITPGPFATSDSFGK